MSTPLTTSAQEINLDDVVAKVRDDICEIDSECMAPPLPNQIEV
jgi:hypothetical protein